MRRRRLREVATAQCCWVEVLCLNKGLEVFTVPEVLHAPDVSSASEAAKPEPLALTTRVAFRFRVVQSVT